MNILVSEDNVLTLKTIEYVLRKAGYEVFKAEDGVQAIKILEQEEVDLVITDINMPYTKGLELVRHINANHSSSIPVIIITGITQSETRDHAMDLGARGYLTKPLDLDDLVGMVRSVTARN